MSKPTMNRLLAFKKQKVPSPATESSDPIDKRLWRRKKAAPEPQAEPAKPVLTPETLPPSEQFRTSLIMPNLSARFSMLREQDDPKSVIGKASDDSVLQPKRKSRLIDFGAANGLGDIAEVSSILEAISLDVPLTRKTSYTYGQRTPPKKRSSVEDSIMNRARGDLGLASGNGSPRRSPRNSPRRTTPRKKSLDLLNGEPPPRLSPFKQYREAEKQQEVRHDLEEYKRQHNDDWNQVILASSKSSSEGKRNKRYSVESPTASLSSAPTASSPLSSSMLAMTETPDSTARSSPAVAHSRPSDPFAPAQLRPDLQRGQSQRTYGEALGKHTFEQRSAALTRLTSIRRNPSMLQRAGTTTKAQTDTQENQDVKKARPQLAKLTTFDSFRTLPKDSSSHVGEPISPSIHSPPLSPFDEIAEEVNPLYNMMNNSDRGKATAMGLFQKPDKFDERQYLQRQLSLMQQQRAKRKSVLPLSPRKATFPGKTASPAKSPRRMKVTRPRGHTDASDVSWTAGGDDVFEAVSEEKEHDLSKQDSALSLGGVPEIIEETPELDRLTQSAPQVTSSKSVQVPTIITTPNKEEPSLSNHPALRLKDNNIRARRNGLNPDQMLAVKNGSPTEQPEEDDWPLRNDENGSAMPLKSPKLFELKGMVHSHLRQQSNASTIFPMQGGHVPSMYMSAWDSSSNLEKLIGGKMPKSPFLDPRATMPPPKSPSPKNPTLRTLISQEEDRSKSSTPEHDSRQHTRGGSSETQHERRAFADELAQRQKTIQENLKIKVENESRAVVNPVATTRTPLDLSLKPFAILRAKASRESIVPVKTQDVPSKGNRWVDMSVDEVSPSRTGDKESGRDPLSPGVGRTLHSKLKTADEPVPAKKQATATKKETVAAKITQFEEISRPSKDSSRSATSSSPTREASSKNSYKTKTSSEQGRSSGESNAEASKVRTPPPPPPSFSHPLPRAKAASPTSTPPAIPPVPKSAVPPIALTTNTPSTTHPTFIEPSTTNRPPPAPHSAPPQLIHLPPPTTKPSHPQPTLPQQPSLLRRRAQAYAQQLQLPSTHLTRKTDTSNPPHIRKADISNPIALLASTFPGDVVALPEGASLRNGMRDSRDFEDVVLAARAMQQQRPGVAVLSNAAGSGRSVSAGVVTEKEKEKEREKSGKGVVPLSYKKGFERGILAKVGRSVSAEKERRRVT